MIGSKWPSHSSNDGRLQAKVAEKRKLQRQLENAVSVLNASTCENTKLREKIDRLRRERNTFDKVFNQLKKGIDGNTKTIERMKMESNEERLACEKSKQKTAALGKVLDKERRAFHKHVKEMRTQVEYAGKQEKTLAARGNASEEAHESTNQEPHDRTHKRARSYVVAEEEATFSEQALKMRILKLSFLNTIQRRHIRQHQKNIEVFEQAFATIRSTTGISDVEEIVKIFIHLEQRNFSLLTYVNTLNSEIESFHIRNQTLSKQLEDFKQQQNTATSRMNDALTDVRQQIARTINAKEEKDRLIEDSVGVLADCRPLIWDTVQLLHSTVPSLMAGSYDSEAPFSEMSPPEEHTEDLSVFLIYIENAFSQFRLILRREKVGSGVLPAPRSTPAGRKPTTTLDLLPQIPGEDTDDEPDNAAERPLNRNELMSRALTNVNSRRRKRHSVPSQKHEPPEEEDDAQMPSRQGLPQRLEPPASTASITSKASDPNGEGIGSGPAGTEEEGSGVARAINSRRPRSSR